MASSAKMQCRVCIEVPPRTLFFKLDFEETRKMFEKCTSVRLDLKGDIPNHICSNCYNKCKEILAFQDRANEADKKWRMKSFLDNALIEWTDEDVPEFIQLKTEDPMMEVEEPPDVAIHVQVDSKASIEFVDVKTIEEVSKQNRTIEDPRPPMKQVSAPVPHTCPFCRKKFMEKLLMEFHVDRNHRNESKGAEDWQEDKFLVDSTYSEAPEITCTQLSERGETTGDDPIKLVRADPQNLIKTARKTYIWPCTKCSQHFDTKRLLRAHMKAHRAENVARRVTSKTERPEISPTQPSKRGESTGDDTIKLVTADPPQNLIKTARKTYIWPCTKCSEHFDTNRLLRAHMKAHRAENVARGVTSKTERPQKSPTQTQPLKRRETTKDDPVALIDTDPLQSLARTSRNMSKFWMCTICGKKFVSRSTLLAHNIRHRSSDKAGQFPCTMCEMKFQYEITLKAHLRYHTRTSLSQRQTPENCPVKITPQRERPRDSGTKEGKSAKCVQCDREFVSLAFLQKHLEMFHADQRPEEVLIKIG